MTNQVAITMLKNLEQSLDDYCELNDEGKEAFHMAITALELFGNSEQLPSTHSKLEKNSQKLDNENGELISRQAAIDAVDKRFDGIPMEQTQEILLLRRDLRTLPSVQPERKKGKWIKMPEFCGDDVSGFIDNHFSCSECKKEADINPWGFYILSDFCPNCGADMRGEQE